MGKGFSTGNVAGRINLNASRKVCLAGVMVQEKPREIIKAVECEQRRRCSGLWALVIWKQTWMVYS